jgi:quinohemoprotein ethanol dehydrogenase
VAQCSRCHQLGPSSTPDLRRLNDGLHVAFKDIVLKGILAPAGMEKFDDILSEQDVENVHAYFIDQAWTLYEAEQGKARQGAAPAGQ